MKQTPDTIPTSLKNKIYFWIIDLGLLKENSIQADDIPNLCCNGVLLADIINRLEGVLIYITFRKQKVSKV